MTARRLVAALAVTIVFALTQPGIASAHSFLVSTDPAKDAVVATAPARVSGTFNEQLQPLYPVMTILGPDGRADRWDSGDPTVSGAVLSVGMKGAAPAGKYIVNYRVTSGDGHPVSGSWTFTTTAASAPRPDDTPAPATPNASSSSAGKKSSGEAPVWPFAVGTVLAVGVALYFSARRGSR